MAMQRPMWTIAFIFVCLLVVPGIILTHYSVAALMPSLTDLPANIIKGFDEVFKFKYLEQDSKDVAKAAADVLVPCNLVAATVCKTGTAPYGMTNIVGQKTISTVNAKKKIDAAFGTSLSVITKVANDKYFGTKELKDTADNLKKMVEEIAKVTDSMTCYAAGPVFCAIHGSGDALAGGVTEVNKGLDKFKKSKIIEQWDKNAGFLNVLHALPYFMVLALVCFAFFWWKGGICCCCKGGTKAGLLLIPMAILWLASFVIYLIVFVVGVGIKYAADRVNVDALQGKPTLEQAINHIMTNYSEFWNVVFAEMVDGLDLLFHASAFLTACAILIALYSCCECCCRPYTQAVGDEGKI